MNTASGVFTYSVASLGSFGYSFLNLTRKEWTFLKNWKGQTR